MKTNQESKQDSEKAILCQTICKLDQIIEKSDEYNSQLCIGFIDYEKVLTQ